MERAEKDVVLSKLREINELVSQFDPAIRSQAFEILRPLYFDPQGLPAEKNQPDGRNSPAPSDPAKFFAQWPADKADENVMHIVAWLYSQHGDIGFTAPVLKQQATRAGLIIPNRPDMSIKRRKAEGKAIFQLTPTGYKLTTAGQMHVQNTYHVTMGSQPFGAKN